MGDNTGDNTARNLANRVPFCGDRTCTDIATVVAFAFSCHEVPHSRLLAVGRIGNPV